MGGVFINGLWTILKSPTNATRKPCTLPADAHVKTHTGSVNIAADRIVMSVDYEDSTPLVMSRKSLISLSSTEARDTMHQGTLDVDIGPRHLVADVFITGQRAIVEAFDTFTANKILELCQ